MPEKKPKYRYPGVNYFRREDRDVFCGRDEDARKLYTQVMLSKTVVLHGDSGTGKSSLLQAGLLPLLEENDPEYVPVLIRFDEYKKSDRNTPESEIVVQSLIRQTISKMLSMGVDLPEKRLPYISDREDDLWYEVKLFEYNKRSILFIFDQFEEIQGYNIKEIRYFIQELADLFKSEVPADIYAEIQENMSQLFEKPDISDAERETFNRSMRFLESPLKVKVLFTIREDKLGLMSRLSDKFPDILKNDYLLRQLTPENAHKAITDPADRDGDYVSQKFTFDNTDTLIRNLTEANTGLVDPLQIQIICSNIERTIAVRNRVIYEKDIPPIDDIINSFYTNCWAEVKNALNLTTANFDKMRRYYIRELVAGDKRKLVFRDDFSRPEFSAYTTETIIILCRTGLLREVSSDIGSYYQLSHDRLIAPLMNDLVQLNARKEADAAKAEADKRTRKRLNTVGFLGLIGVAIFATAFFYIKRVGKLRERELLQKAEKQQDKLDKLTAIAENKELQRQRDSAADYAANANLMRQKDSAASVARNAELERKKDSAVARIKYKELQFAQVRATDNAKRDSIEKAMERENLQLRVTQANNIKDSMQKILVASDIAKLSQQSKTNFEQKVYAWLAYDTLPAKHRDVGFSPGVYGALANALLDSLRVPGPRVAAGSWRGGFVGVEKVFHVNGKRYYSIPFRGIKDINDQLLVRDSTMIRSWVDNGGTVVASVNVAAKDRKSFVVRMIASARDTVLHVPLGSHEDINSVVFDMSGAHCIYSTVRYDGQAGKVYHITIAGRKSVDMQAPLGKGEYMYLGMEAHLSGITNTGKYFDWDAAYTHATLHEDRTLSDKLAPLNHVRYMLQLPGSVFVGDEFGNVYTVTESEQPRILASESGRVISIAASSDKAWAAASFANGTMVLWRLNSPRPVPAFLAGANACVNNKATGRFSVLAFSADNESLLAINEYGRIYRFPLSMTGLAGRICKSSAYLNDPVARRKNNVPSKIKNVCD